jgi:transposase-like protein
VKTVRKTYTQTFKDSLVAQVLDGSLPITEVAKANGVDPGSLRLWVNKKRGTLVEHAADPAAELTTMKSMEQEIRELKQEMVFLKKGASYCASQPQ